VTLSRRRGRRRGGAHFQLGIGGSHIADGRKSDREGRFEKQVAFRFTVQESFEVDT
jgi:hypothetical protein